MEIIYKYATNDNPPENELIIGNVMRRDSKHLLHLNIKKVLKKYHVVRSC